jgi:hypothetical protein
MANPLKALKSAWQLPKPMPCEKSAHSLPLIGLAPLLTGIVMHVRYKAQSGAHSSFNLI